MPDDIFKKYYTKYQAEYQERYSAHAKSLASEMLKRLEAANPGIEVPGTHGGMALYYDSFAGPRPAIEVAEFLDMLKDKLRD